MSLPIPTLIVGYGNMGARHARVVRELGGDAALWGIVDPNAERRHLALGDNRSCRTFASVEEAVGAAERPGCAIVAARTPLHAVLGRAILERRIPLLIEKPIASTVSDGEALVEMAARQETLLTVGHVERFNPAAVALRKLVGSRLIGEILQICFRRVGGSPADVTTSDDVLADLGVHDYDLARFITGADLEIVAALGHRENGRLDGALVLGRLSTGTSMQLQVNWRTPVKVRRIELTGSDGYVEVDLITQQIVLYRKNPLLIAAELSPESISSYDTFIRSFASPDRVELRVERREPLLEQTAAFWRAVDGGGAPSLLASDAVTALRLADVTRELVDS